MHAQMKATLMFLFRRVAPSLEAVKDQNICNKIMVQLIQNYSRIFDAESDPEDPDLTEELPTPRLLQVQQMFL